MKRDVAIKFPKNAPKLTRVPDDRQ